MEDATKQRISAGLMALAASTLVALATSEGYTPDAVVPVPGDVPTKGFGTTRNADGTPVKLGDKTTPQRALVDLLRDASASEQAVKRCAPVPMHPHEFSAYVKFTYNVGEAAFCNSTLVRKLNNFDYDGACKELLRWDKVAGQPVRGLTLRRQSEYRECIGEGQ